MWKERSEDGEKSKEGTVHIIIPSHDMISDTYYNTGYNTHGYLSDSKDMSCVHVWCMCVLVNTGWTVWYVGR